MSSDAQALLAKAKESLDAAELLRSRNYFDYAASRAYYSMFYVAEALLAAQGESYSSHSAVIAAYGREFAKTGKLDPTFHRRLIDAQDYRNIGDYGISAHVLPEQAERVCGWAREFLAEANKYFGIGES